MACRPACQRFSKTQAAESSPSRDDDALTLQVPGDGGIAALRELLARLDEWSLEVEELSVYTPDLDDVFLTLTGRTNTHKETVR